MDGKTIKILLVEDNRADIVMLQELFSAASTVQFRMVPVNRLSGAFEQLAEADFDVILLDLNFTSSINTGNEGIFWLKKIKEFRSEAAVIMITAYGDEDTKRKALQGGADALFTKPIDFALLRSEIDMRVERAA